MAVGDVVGRGIPAATVMGQLRTALRAYALEGHGPARTLDHLDAFATTIDGAFCASVVYAELDLVTGELWYSSAGHPPPVLVTPDSQISVLWEGRSPLLGIDTTTHKAQALVQMPVNARLLLFTDGLIEAQTRGIDQGLDELAEHLQYDHDIDLDTLVKKIDVHEAYNDDICVLSLTRRNVPAGETGTL